MDGVLTVKMQGQLKLKGKVKNSLYQEKSTKKTNFDVPIVSEEPLILNRQTPNV